MPVPLQLMLRGGVCGRVAATPVQLIAQEAERVSD